MIKIGDVYHETAKLPVGAKIKFAREKHRYTVQASNVAFAVCTKPLNMIRRLGGGKYEFEKTVMYTIVSWFENARGPENKIFGLGAETPEQCADMLERLTQGESLVSHRHRCDLDVVRVDFPKGYFGRRKTRK